MVANLLQEGTRDICRDCGAVVTYGLPSDTPFAWRKQWYDADRQGEPYASLKCPARLEADHRPTQWCMSQKSDGDTCGRRISSEAQREGVYACGVHYKKEAAEVAHMKVVEEQRRKRADENGIMAWSTEEVVRMAQIFKERTGIEAEVVTGFRRFGDDGHTHSGLVTLNIMELFDYLEWRKLLHDIPPEPQPEDDAAEVSV